MAFYPQPFMYQCGPFALKYGLIMLGKMEDEKEIEDLAGSTWWSGTNEIGLEKAANHYECNLNEIKLTGDPASALNSLNKHLSRNYPAILCVDKWSHWITVIKKEDNKYICMDSAMKKVIILLSERELLRRWKYVDNNLILYSGYTLVPWYKPRVRAKFNKSIVKKLMSDKYKSLALNWDSYFKVLYELNHGSRKTFSFKEFLRRNQNQLVKLVADWQGEIEYEELEMILENFRFIAEVYDLKIHSGEEKAALIHLASVLMLHATNLYGTYKIL